MKTHRYLVVGNPPAALQQDLQLIFPNETITLTKTSDTTAFQLLGSVDLPWQNYSNQLIDLAQKYRVDFSFNAVPAKLTRPRLMVFDMDSTLIAHEVIDEIGKVAGLGDKIARVTEMAMRGEIDFIQALLDRVILLKGIPRSELTHIFNSLSINPGVESLMQKARTMGIKTAIVSGGFSFFAENLRQKLNMDYALSNELEFENDKLTGRIVGKIVDAERKRDFMFELGKKYAIAPHESIAVGDGANDLAMLEAAGMGVAWHAKDKVKRAVGNHISYGPMTNLLHFL